MIISSLKFMGSTKKHLLESPTKIHFLTWYQMKIKYFWNHFSNHLSMNWEMKVIKKYKKKVFLENHKLYFSKPHYLSETKHSPENEMYINVITVKFPITFF